MKKILLGMTLLLFSLSSHAVLLTYDLVYTSDTTAATGIGFVTIDDTVFSNTAANDLDVPAATLGITAFSLTISGASAGNGTFDLTDIGLFSWNRTAPYGLSMEILGQAGHVNFNIHSSIASSPVPPNAGEPFSGGSNNQITTDLDAGTDATNPLTEAKLLTAGQTAYNNGSEVDTLMIKPADAQIVAGFSAASGRNREIAQGKTLVNAIDLYVEEVSVH